MGELTGEVIAVLQKEGGQSKAGKEWSKQTVILETPGQYATKVAVDLWGDKVGSLSVGEITTVSYNPESREHNSRWYTTLKVWKTVSGSSTPSATNKQTHTAPPTSNFSEDDQDALPF